MVAKLLARTYAIMSLVRLRFAQHAFCILLLAVVIPGEISAQSSNFEGKNIVAIRFIPPEQPIDPSELHEIFPLKRDTPLHMSDVRTAIERLFETGLYTDIQVDAEPRNNGVLIRFITKQSWFIGRVSVDGNISGPPNSSQLANATRLELGQPYTDEKLAQARDGLRVLFESNGQFRSHVEPRFHYDSRTQQVSLSFVVDSGKRANFTTPDLEGDLKLSPEKIISATKWRHSFLTRWFQGIWKPVTSSRVQQGLKGVREQYLKADRLEAKVSLNSLKYDSDTNRAKPVLDINGGPRLEVRTIGMKLSDKKLQRYLPVYEEHTVDRDLLEEGSRDLKNYLQSQGYFEAQVEFKRQRIINDKATIDYLINRGPSHKLVYIGIDGNRYFSTSTIRERMLMQTSSFLQYRHGRYSGAMLREDKESIANLYQSNGFRDVAVTSKVVDDYKGKSGEIAVFIHIDEGPQWYVANLQVNGIKRLDKKAILSMLSSIPGQPYSEYNVAIDRDAILAQYYSNGFPDVRFEWSSKPSAKPHQVDLTYVITEGEQQFVREVLIGGLETTRPSLVYKNLLLNPGDPLSPDRMAETQRRLYDLGIFSKVDMAIQNPDGDTQKKYVDYQMYEARRYSITTGVGAEIAKIGGGQTSLEAPAGQTGFSPRVSLNVSRLNLFGLGHTVTLSTRASTLEKRGVLSYQAPRFRNRDNLSLSFTSLYDDSRNVRTFSARRLEGSVQMAQKWSKATTLFYRYSYRRVSVDESSLKISPLLIPLLAQPVRVGMLALNMVQDRRDDPLDTRKGIYNTMDLGLAENVFGSQRNFLRFLGRNATYHPIGRKFVLARNTQFGDLYAFNTRNPLEEIPLAERFFSGGATSNRGFPDFQAGPRDPTTGFPVGGTALLFNQTELRFPLIGENIGGVLFHDAGNVYSSLGNISFRVHQRDVSDFDYMVHAVGFGLRYRTPIGPLRLDFAYSINPPKFIGFKGTQEEFLQAGVNPCNSPLFPDRCVQQQMSHFQFFFSIGQTF